MTIWRLLAAFAVAIMPAAAEAGTFNLKNCSALVLDVVVVRSDNNMISMQTVVMPGATGNLNCAVAACRLQIHYNGTTTTIGSFPGPYSDDRCTRGTMDAPVGDLPAAGNCGC